MINTGWTGGPYDLDNAEYRQDPVFGLEVPLAIEGVPTEILTPRDTWQDTDAFDAQARKLAAMFRDNFAHYAPGMDSAVADSGPQA
jgi:phosphoenolpyruvate carboxykinase (ATP)